MGNRAVIALSTRKDAPVVYLHWGGSPDNVESILKGLRDSHFTGTPAKIMNAIAGEARYQMNVPPGVTVYREKYGETDTDNGDNGVYIINKEFKVVRRLFNSN